MAFLSPLWLGGLIGWLGVALWLLGRRRKTAVPFLPLWRTSDEPRQPRRRLEMPPLMTVLVLAAIFLAIAAAARPAVQSGSKLSRNVTIVVDRGLTMSASGPGGVPRFVKAAELVDAALRNDSAGARVQLEVVPPVGADVHGGEMRDWMDEVRGLSMTAVVDPEAVADTARRAAEEGRDVVVLSDQNLVLDNSRIVQVSLDPSPNVGIELFSVRSDARSEAMARVVNRSVSYSATLIVRVDGRTITRMLSLPPCGGERNYFVDLPMPGKVVEAEIQGDDLPALNHQAWSVRSSNWPNILQPGHLSDELGRMVEVYSRRRPAGEESRAITVVNGLDAIPTDVPAAVVDDAANGRVLSSVDPLMVASAPLDTSDVDWSSVLVGAKVSAEPGGDWQPLVRAGGKTVVAIRTQPVKQVWVGFGSERFSRQVDFVLFWSRVFDWLGDGARAYTTQPVGSLEGQWQLQRPNGLAVSRQDMGLLPGVYRREDGVLAAVNSPPMPASAAVSDWSEKLSNLGPAMRPLRPLSAQLVLIVIALLNFVALIAIRRGSYGGSFRAKTIKS